MGDFNPRSPQGERQATSEAIAERGGDFNPRSPQGERLRRGQQRPENGPISIHAPRKGSDT